MTLAALCNRDTVSVRTLTATKDAAMHTSEALSAETASLKCRVVELTSRQAWKFEQEGLNQMYQFLFAADPSLTLANALVWDSKVWRCREITNAGNMDRMWAVIAEHVPQVELTP